jgi:hypothetical protein
MNVPLPEGNGALMIMVTGGALWNARYTLRTSAWLRGRTGADLKKEGQAGVRITRALLTLVQSASLGIATLNPNAQM